MLSETAKYIVAVIVVLAVILIVVCMDRTREKLTVMPGVPLLPSDLNVPNRRKFRNFILSSDTYCGCSDAPAQPARYMYCL